MILTQQRGWEAGALIGQAWVMCPGAQAESAHPLSPTLARSHSPSMGEGWVSKETVGPFTRRGLKCLVGKNNRRPPSGDRFHLKPLGRGRQDERRDWMSSVWFILRLEKGSQATGPLRGLSETPSCAEGSQGLQGETRIALPSRSHLSEPPHGWSRGSCCKTVWQFLQRIKHRILL